MGKKSKKAKEKVEEAAKYDHPVITPSRIDNREVQATIKLVLLHFLMDDVVPAFEPAAPEAESESSMYQSLLPCTYNYKQNIRPFLRLPRIRLPRFVPCWSLPSR